MATWMMPTGMTSYVHAFDAHEGGFFRISLTYDAPTGTGTTTASNVPIQVPGLSNEVRQKLTQTRRMVACYAQHPQRFENRVVHAHARVQGAGRVLEDDLDLAPK